MAGSLSTFSLKEIVGLFSNPISEKPRVELTISTDIIRKDTTLIALGPCVKRLHPSDFAALNTMNPGLSFNFLPPPKRFSSCGRHCLTPGIFHLKKPLQFPSEHLQKVQSNV
jgi:hypothetical protein